MVYTFSFDNEIVDTSVIDGLNTFNYSTKAH